MTLAAVAAQREPRPLGNARRIGRRQWRRLAALPRAAWLCAAIACLNGACWSILSPPFETTDEPSHFAYVQALAETSRLPSANSEAFSRAEVAALVGLHYPSVFFRPKNIPVASALEQSALEGDLARGLSRTTEAANVATSEPPLYYALQTIPYELGAGGNVLDQLALMRLLSALLGGVTAFFAFLFVREALPGARWAWTVAGLSVAVAPLLGMVSGSVNPEALCVAAATALFYGLARAFRGGLTPKLGAALGATIAVGCLAKLNFLGLVPGAVLGLCVLYARGARESKGSARRALALALGLAAAAAVPYALYRLLAGGLAFAPTANETGLVAGHGSVVHEAEYIWQLFLPRLPGMHPYFQGIFTTRVLWFNGLVGLYGWLDTTFPAWVYSAALAPAALIGLLCLRTLILRASAVRARATEIVVYCAMGLGVLVSIGAGDYSNEVPGEFREPRYLLPMIALWGAVLALSARGAGRRFGRAAGALIVLLFLAHDLFSQLLVISRFYG
jgi:hypothetical protein